MNINLSKYKCCFSGFFYIIYTHNNNGSFVKNKHINLLLLTICYFYILSISAVNFNVTFIPKSTIGVRLKLNWFQKYFTVFYIVVNIKLAHLDW